MTDPDWKQDQAETTRIKPAAPSSPNTADEVARKAALFREGAKRIYDGQGDRADMWFFELWHFLGDVEKALSASSAVTNTWLPIETAPKDRKIDLLYAYPRGRTIDCEWREGGVDGDGRWVWLKPIWGSQPGLGIDWHLLPEAEWEVCSYPNMEPTHWMDRPNDPVGIQQDSGADQ